MKDSGSVLGDKAIMIGVEMKGLPPVEQIKGAILSMDYDFFSKQSITVKVSCSLLNNLHLYSYHSYA